MDFSKLKIIQYAEQKGYEEGYPIGYAEGVKIAHQIALDRMYEQGFSEGKAEGKSIGRKEALIYTVEILIIKKIGLLSSDIIDHIKNLRELELEVLIFELVGKMNTVDDLKKFLHIE